MKNLKAAAKEINEILKPEPPVSIKVGINKADITGELLELSEEIESGDSFSDETLSTLESIGAKFDWRKAKEEEEEEEEEIEEEEEEEEEEDTAEKTEEKAEGKAKEKAEKEDKKPKAGAKEKDKKKTAKEDKKLKPTVETKDDTKSAKKEPKKDKKPRYSRGAALIDALSKGGTRGDLITLIDDLYEKNGGQRNANGAKVMLDIHIPVLKLAGCLEEKNGKLKLVK